MYEFFKLVRNVRPLFARIKHHTLIFHPRNDDQSDIKNTAQLQRDLGGLVEVCVLDDSYHLVTLDRQRGYVADRSIEFVDRVLAREAAKPATMRPAVVSTKTLQQGAAE